MNINKICLAGFLLLCVCVREREREGERERERARERQRETKREKFISYVFFSGRSQRQPHGILLRATDVRAKRVIDRVTTRTQW